MKKDRFLKFENELKNLVQECGIDRYLKMRDDQVAHLLCRYIRNLWHIMHDRDTWRASMARKVEQELAEINKFSHKSANKSSKSNKPDTFDGNTPPGQDERLPAMEAEIDQKFQKLSKRYDKLWDVVESLLTAKNVPAKDFTDANAEAADVPAKDFTYPGIEAVNTEGSNDLFKGFTDAHAETVSAIVKGYSDPHEEAVNEIVRGYSDPHEEAVNEIVRGYSDPHEETVNDIVKGYSDPHEEVVSNLVRGYSDPNAEVLNDLVKSFSDSDNVGTYVPKNDFSVLDSAGRVAETAYDSANDYSDPNAGLMNDLLIHFPDQTDETDYAPASGFQNFSFAVETESTMKSVPAPEPAPVPRPAPTLKAAPPLRVAPAPEPLSAPPPKAAPAPVPKPAPAPVSAPKAAPEPDAYDDQSPPLTYVQNCTRLGRPEAGFHISCYKCSKQMECQDSHEVQKGRARIS
jgi:hypothetical protein